eukprot:COSAG02_NODE_2627_length_8394_cov_8.718143_3_plen_156_part_00
MAAMLPPVVPPRYAEPVRFTRLAQPRRRTQPQQEPAPPPPPAELLVRDSTTREYRLGSLVATATLADLRAAVAKLRALPELLPKPKPGLSAEPELEPEPEPVPEPEPEPDPKPVPEVEAITADAETARWIKENTRPCPSCGTVIEKAGGCVRHAL